MHIKRCVAEKLRIDIETIKRFLNRFKTIPDVIISVWLKKVCIPISLKPTVQKSHTYFMPPHITFCENSITNRKQ